MKLILTVIFLLVNTLLLTAQSVTTASDKSFLAFLDKADAAQLELQNGKVDGYKAIWSHSDDVTLIGGFGGTIEKGWANVSKRIDWVGGQFSNGTNSIARIVASSSGNFGYAIQREHISFTVPGEKAATTRDYRVTMIFRREKGEWKVVHRHADSQLTKEAPK